MLRRLLTGATASASSSQSIRRVSNQVVPILSRVNHPSTACCSSPGLSSSQIHLTPSLSSLGTHLRLSAFGTQTASISCGISANEDVDRTAGGGEGSTGRDESGGSGCLDPAEAEGLSQENAADADLSPQELPLLDAAKASSKDPAKAEDLSPEDIEKLISCLCSASDSDYAGAMQMMELRGLCPSPSSVAVVLSHLAKNCDAALAFFSWAMRQPGNQLSYREFRSMVVILVKGQRFEAALSFIQQTARSQPSSVTWDSVLCLLKMYCATGQVENAIATFDSLVELGCRAGTLEFESLLSFLCHNGKVAEAEKLLLREEKRFPFCTRRFNIVLRGWCDILVSPPKAKRFWLSMKDMGLQHDLDSYGTMISCLTKSKDVDGVLKLFDEMKDLGISPDMMVYNCVLTALVKTDCVKGAMDLIRKMKEEKGMVPGNSTFSSLFWKACRIGSAEGVVELLNMMTKNGVRLSKRSVRVAWHLFEKPLNDIFNELRMGEDILAVLSAITQSGFCLSIHNYNTLIRKLCMLQDYGGLFMVWGKMCSKGPKPDRKTYISIIYGLSLNKKMEEARRYYLEMRTKGFSPEPRADLVFLVKKMKCP